MPAKSEKQRKFMALCYTNPSKAKRKCPSKAVAHEFMTMGPKRKKSKPDKHGFY